MSESIWMGLEPSPTSTRILAMRSASETILKAHLSLRPSSPHAIVSLMEALALWEGRRVRAALVVADDSSTLPTSVYRDAFAIHGDSSALYELEWVPRAARARRRRDGLDGLGDFRELERLLVSSVAR